MIFYGITHDNKNPYKPFYKFEAADIDEAIQEVEAMREESKNYLLALYKYKGYKRQGNYCIQQILNFRDGEGN